MADETTGTDIERALDEEGIPQLQDVANQDEGMVPPRDHPQAVEEFGVTAEEERREEPVAERMLREEPDVGDRPGVGDHVHPGQLVDTNDGKLDVEGDAIAGEEDRSGALAPEEAAMHVVEERSTGRRM